jgi:hypothetical protein
VVAQLDIVSCQPTLLLRASLRNRNWLGNYVSKRSSKPIPVSKRHILMFYEISRLVHFQGVFCSTHLRRTVSVLSILTLTSEGRFLNPKPQTSEEKKARKTPHVLYIILSAVNYGRNNAGSPDPGFVTSPCHNCYSTLSGRE